MLADITLFSKKKKKMQADITLFKKKKENASWYNII